MIHKIIEIERSNTHDTQSITKVDRQIEYKS